MKGLTMQLRFSQKCRTAALKACFLGVVCAGFVGIASGQKLDMEKLEGMKTRSIGPAGMSGRVTGIAVVHSNPDIIYVGTASGGLWKSTSGGTSWKPIFDDQPVASIGALAIDQNNPDVIWAGTGEGNPRNSQTSGDGIYKSLDGGATWKFMGLKNTRNIHRVLINPQNPDIVYAGVQGAAWGEHPERGVYKTTDGGKTWKKILYKTPKTGIGELVMDPVNPNKLFAAMWEFRRWPWSFKSGGPSSGLFVTHDGGETWEQRTDKDGLPKGELGRIGLAVAKSNPSVVYALVEAKKNGLYRSDDGGRKWKLVSEKNIGNRPFYYGELHLDPINENRIYNLHSSVTLSVDGGKTFSPLTSRKNVHPDHHAWFVHPENPNFIINGNDGGLAISRDRGETWRFVENLPLAQFYHINVDMETPYRIMGGLQDNGSWIGPGYVWRSGGIRNSHWQEVMFGDGFDVVPDQSDSRFGYAMSQGGNVGRFDLETGYIKRIKPVHPEGVRLRFNWNAAIAHDPFDKTTIYYGSQFVHKSTNRGDAWEIISPDLTTNDPEKQKQVDSGGLTYDVTGAENFTSIVAIEPSPVQKDVIWVGTDDGNVQITQDGGATWTNVVGKMKGAPAGIWVPQIRASTYNAGEAFVVLEDHRRNNWAPYVYQTKDFGKSWTRLVDENKVWGYALSFAQDPVEPSLMFVGTEFHLYVSIDSGQNWTKWTNGYPTVSTMDMVIHPRDHDLVIGTFGRSVYVLDDIRPLRALAKEGTAILEKPLHVFEAPDAFLAANQQAAGTRFVAQGEFVGANKSRGAMLSFIYNPPAKSAAKEKVAQGKGEGKKERGKKKKDRVKFEILNAAGDVIRTFSREAKPGLNRTTWGLRRRGVRFPGGGFRRGQRSGGEDEEPRGPAVLPGTYTVRLSAGDHTTETRVNVKSDPRMDVSLAALEARSTMYDELGETVKVVTEAVKNLNSAGASIKIVTARLKGKKEDGAKALGKHSKKVQKSITKLLERVTGEKNVQGIRRNPNTIATKLGLASRIISSALDQPGQTERISSVEAVKASREFIADVNTFFEKEWADYTSAVAAAQVSLFEEFKPLQAK